MNSFNATGRVGRDAITRYTQSQKAVTSWSLAVDSGFGENKKTTWLECSGWGDRWVKVADHIKKGNQLAVTGEISLREYEVNGEQRKSLDLSVKDITLLGSKPDSQQESRSEGFREQAADGFEDKDVPF